MDASSKYKTPAWFPSAIKICDSLSRGRIQDTPICDSLSQDCKQDLTFGLQLRGVCSQEYLRCGDLLLAIPNSLIITPTAARSHVMNALHGKWWGHQRKADALTCSLARVEGSSDCEEAWMILFLVCLRRRPQCFPVDFILWSEQLPTFHDQCSFLDHWCEREICCLEQASRKKMIWAHVQRIKSVYSHISHIRIGEGAITLEETSWAQNVVLSRAFQLNGHESGDTWCLLPWADFFNHGFVDRKAVSSDSIVMDAYEYNKHTECFEFHLPGSDVPDHGWGPGCPLKLQYTENTRALVTFLEFYGFIPEEYREVLLSSDSVQSDEGNVLNTWEDTFPVQEEDLMDHAQSSTLSFNGETLLMRAKQSIIETRDLRLPEDLFFSVQGYPSRTLISLLRVLLADQSEMKFVHSMCATVRTIDTAFLQSCIGMLSISNEITVYKVLNAYVVSCLKHYSTSIREDQDVLIRIQEQSDHAHLTPAACAYFLRILDKKILTSSYIFTSQVLKSLYLVRSHSLSVFDPNHLILIKTRNQKSDSHSQAESGDARKSGMYMRRFLKKSK